MRKNTGKAGEKFTSADGVKEETSCPCLFLPAVYAEGFDTASIFYDFSLSLVKNQAIAQALPQAFIPSYCLHGAATSLFLS